jgi:hypothetical protein
MFFERAAELCLAKIGFNSYFQLLVGLPPTCPMAIPAFASQQLQWRRDNDK